MGDAPHCEMWARQYGKECEGERARLGTRTRATRPEDHRGQQYQPGAEGMYELEFPAPQLPAADR